MPPEKAVPIRPMRIAFPDEDIDDLRWRLRRTRWLSPVAGSAWADGTDGGYLRDLTAYWLSQYDWREREARLNEFDHFLADVDGTEIHFIRADGQGPNPIPLLLLQGWPSSFVQMLDIIPLLTEDRRDGTPSFDVIAASLPFAGRGSDQGGLVQQQMGLKYPQHLIGLHRSGITPFAVPLPRDLGAAEVAYQKQVESTVPAPREWAERTYNVQRWTVMEHGGHFPEWEVPRVVATDVRTFFADLPP